MKKAGIVVLLIGLAFTMFTGFNFVTKENVVDIGELEINANMNHSVTWSPILGVVTIAVGAGLYLLGSRRSASF